MGSFPEPPLPQGVEAKYRMGGGWGNTIGYTNADRVTIDPAKPDQTFTVAGFKPLSRRPKLGDTIAAEFQRSWVVWEIVELRFPGDPPDMFFAEVKVKTQVWKEGGKPV